MIRVVSITFSYKAIPQYSVHMNFPLTIDHMSRENSCVKDKCSSRQYNNSTTVRRYRAGGAGLQFAIARSPFAVHRTTTDQVELHRGM